MTTEELSAAIEATKTQVQAALATRRELSAAKQQALQRQRLRRELDEQREILNAELDYNADEEYYRDLIDQDRCGDHLPASGQGPPHESNMCANSEEVTSFGSKVAKGEYTWKLAEMSWLRSTVRYASGGFVMSEWFQVGACKCRFFYHPDGGFILYDSERVHNKRGSLAIIAPSSAESFVLRYSIYAKSRGGDFVQWGKTHDEFKSLGLCQAFGPDVHPDTDGSPPPTMGLFGLSHDQLLQSEWVHDDVLTLKFVLEVRPQGMYSSQVVAREVAGVPDSTLCRDTQALLEQGSYSDVEFRLQGEVIRAHSQVLCARSEVLKKQLNSGMKESMSKVILIEDCSAATFKAFLRFLYTDTLPSAEDLAAEPSSQALKEEGGRITSQMEALWAVSHKYQVERLQRWCEAQLCKQLSAEQVCGVLRQAHVFEATQLEKACLSYIKDNAAQVLKLQAYADLISNWPEVALKIHLFSTGVPEAEAAAIVQARKVRKLEDGTEKTS